ncbi:MAG: hypothetical protein WKF34_08560 [Pyrinomonadaceae bacterium]
MRIRIITLLALAIALLAACGATQPATPLETFKTYIKAMKAKDTTTMKILLSKATLKTHEQEAKAQGVTVDDIVKRDTTVNENQKTVEFRDEKIDGDKATLQVKTGYGSWETIPFIREDGDWKIDKQGYADKMLEEMDQSQRELDRIFNSNSTPSVY